MKPAIGLIVHGGAGTVRRRTPAVLQARRKALVNALQAGFQALQGGCALDAVEAAVVSMEDSGVFNAGSGSYLNLEGRMEMDAAIMDGETLSTGAVAGLGGFRNPVVIARQVMDRTDHVLMAGSNQQILSRVAQAQPVELRPKATVLQRFEELKKQWREGKVEGWLHNKALIERNPDLLEQGTVGAAARDEAGNLAAAVSTGGRWLKLPGRIGDSAIVGAGLYADNFAGAAVATGAGEDIIKVCLTKSVCDFMNFGLDASGACEAATRIITRRRGRGTAGVIALDRSGRPGFAFNTEMMATGLFFKGMNRPWANPLGPPKTGDEFAGKVRLSI